VMAFFILSGFIISEARNVFHYHRPWEFIANRLLRLAPSYLLARALSIAPHWLSLQCRPMPILSKHWHTSFCF
jgi:peptidoglycan/LPS O-acetylase OafA/YrhL